MPSARPRPSPRPELAARLEAIAGLAVEAGAPLAPLTTFKIGGRAGLLVEVASQRALQLLLGEVREAGAPLHLLGLGSNVLVPDQGLPGLVVRLGGELRRARVRGAWVSAGGAVPLPRLARRLTERGLLGLEALTGFPSSVGGAVRMNAGCYGSEIRETLVAAVVIERDGRRRRLRTAELEPAYRYTNLQKSGAIVTRALFRLRPGDPGPALARIAEWNRRRWASLPTREPNAGSIFKNPPGDYAGRLIEACGLKGEVAGRAQISPKHANVIVNLGGAGAGDVLALMLRARREVARRFGVRLEPELVLAGPLAGEWERSN